MSMIAKLKFVAAALVLIVLDATGRMRGPAAERTDTGALAPREPGGLPARRPQDRRALERPAAGGNFTVGELSVSIGPDQGAWGPFAHNYRLDFSSLKEAGTLPDPVREP